MPLCYVRYQLFQATLLYISILGRVFFGLCLFAYQVLQVDFVCVQAVGRHWTHHQKAAPTSLKSFLSVLQ